VGFAGDFVSTVDRGVFVISAGILLVCAYLLVTNSPLLLQQVIGEPSVPAGTVVAWFGLFSLAATARQLSLMLGAPAAIMGLFWLSLAIAAGWGLVSYLLAADWHFNFSARAEGFRGSDAAAHWFWRYSFLVAGLPVVLLSVAAITAIVRRVWRTSVNR
jgi:hypothetical protein